MVLWLYKQAFENLSTEQWTGLVNKAKQGCCALQRKSHLWILRKGIAYSAAGKYVDRSWKYLKHTQTHECGTWDWGSSIPFLGIFVSNFRYCAFAVCTERNSNYLVIKFISIGTQMLLSPYKYTVGILTYYCLSIQCADVCIIASRYRALRYVLWSPDTVRWCSNRCHSILSADVCIIVTDTVRWCSY